MITAELTIEGFLDGAKIAGFPYTKALEVGRVLVFTNRITSTAQFVDVFPNFQPTTNQHIRFILLCPSAAGQLCVLDDTFTVPVTLGANMLWGAFNIDGEHSLALPFISFKAGTNPTDLFVAVGFM